LQENSRLHAPVYDQLRMTTTTAHRYIVRDSQILGGEPIIVGTRTPVRAIVEIWRLGTAPDQILSHLPHLTQAQIFDALSCYSDNTDEINKLIEQNMTPQHRNDQARTVQRAAPSSI